MPTNPLRSALRYHRLRSSWLGDGGQPVPSPLAHSRATTCLSCPYNDADQPIWELITATATHELRQQIELKHQLSLSTPHDEKLHVCGVCDCYLPLKIWAPIKHIMATTDTGAMPPFCWITKEWVKGDQEKP